MFFWFFVCLFLQIVGSNGLHCTFYVFSRISMFCDVNSVTVVLMYFFAFCSGLQPQLKLFWIYRIWVLYYIFYSGVKLILSLYRLSWFHSRNKDCKFRAGPSMMPCEAIDSKTSTDTICAFLLESIASPLWIGKEDDREVMWKGGKD